MVLTSIFWKSTIALLYFAGLTSALPSPGYSQMTDFGPNPTDIGMSVYVPSGVIAHPGVLVALHYCGGTGDGFYSGTQYAAVANEKKSFIVLYGNSPPSRYTKCWDVASPETLTHDKGGDSLGIASAVRYAVSNWDADPNGVFVTGQSSGAMMTNVLAGAYPDLFKGGAVFAGVPFGCFGTNNGSFWNDECAAGQVSKTNQEWGDDVRAAYPGYTGSRPKMQLWHGSSDDILNYQNFAEEIKQWTNVLGTADRPGSLHSNDPEPGYTHATYTNALIEAYSAADRPHNLPLRERLVIDWFGL